MKRAPHLLALCARTVGLFIALVTAVAATPTVTVVVPSRTVSYAAPASPVLYATATYSVAPPPATIVRVDFYDGDVRIGSLTASNAANGGYAVVWPNASVGPHAIWATATDSAGDIGKSAPVTLHVVPSRTPPQVDLTTPIAGQTLTASSVVQLQASASSTQGSIQRVEFVAGTSVVATSFAPPYQGTWTNPTAGEYALWARAVDELGVASVSAPVHIQVLPHARLPVTAVTSPAPGTSILAGIPLTLAASAIAPDGAVGRVDFLNGTAVLGSATTVPYQLVWSAPPVGTLSVIAKAYDLQGNSGASAPVTITATAPILPVVSLTAPKTGIVFIAPDPIALAATASTSRTGGRIVKVDFYDGTKLLGTSTIAPFAYNWTTASLGTHVLAAKATDDLGATGMSATASISVVANKAPAVTLTSPVKGAVFVSGQSITLAATATDADGSVAKLEFLNGTAILAALTSAPYTFTWSGAPVGTFAMAARATDNRGAIATSAVTTVQVSATSTPTDVLSAPVSGAAYAQVQPISLSAVGTVPGRTLARIEFLADGVLLGSVGYNGPSTATATFTWTGAAIGAHSITSRAIATDGTTATSVAAAITVRDLRVELFEPAAGQVYVAPGAIRLTAFAAETGTAIRQVEFLRGATVLGTITAPPYTLDWTGAASGTYTVAARVTDVTGLMVTSKPVTVQVVAAPALAFDAGTDGASVSDDNVVIGGTVVAPANSAISINGVLAALDPLGRFFVNNVPLQPGSNALSVTLLAADGTTIQKTITVGSTGRAPFEVLIDQQEGMAPLSATMTINNRGALPFQRIEIDTNDDGKAERTLTSLTDGTALVALSFANPGTYVVRVTVFDASNKSVYMTRRKVHVYDAKALAARVSGVYTGMLRRLATGDITNAVNAITVTTRDRYRDAFTRLGSTLPAVVQGLGKISDITVTQSYADITLQQNMPDGAYEYHVLLIRDSDGIWRIDQM